MVAAVKTLVSRGLPLRSDEEKICLKNNGNFLTLLEFLSKFDPFTKKHIKNHAQKGSGSTTYLSKTIYEELVEFMTKKVRETIIAEVKEAKYYSIIVDSIPDISHVDQLAFILRYVPQNGVAVEPFRKIT